MSLVDNFLWLVPAAIGLCAAPAWAQVGCVPNPNNNGPPFIDGCPLTAAGLNVLASTHFGQPPVGILTPPATLTSNWLLSLIPNTTNVANLASVLSTGNGYGLLGAGRSSDAGTSTTTNAFGLGGFAVSDNTTAGANTRAVWSLYLETRRLATTTDLFTHTAEMDMVNFATPIANGPYLMAAPGITPDLWLSCGRPDVAIPTNCSEAIGVVNNGAPFVQGIVFGNNAIQGNNGVTGSATAILMPKGDSIVWEFTPGTPAGQITSNASALPGGAVNITNSAIFFSSYDGLSNGFQINIISGSTDYLAATPGTSGVTLSAISSNSLSPIVIASKGTANVQINSGGTIDATFGAAGFNVASGGGAYFTNGTAGVTCNAQPTTNWRSINGLVTAC